MRKKYITVRRNDNSVCVYELPVSGYTDREVEKIESGMNINLNHEVYHTDIEERDYTRVRKTLELVNGPKLMIEEILTIDLTAYEKDGWKVIE